MERRVHGTVRAPSGRRERTLRIPDPRQEVTARVLHCEGEVVSGGRILWNTFYNGTLLFSSLFALLLARPRAPSRPRRDHRPSLSRLARELREHVLRGQAGAVPGAGTSTSKAKGKAKGRKGRK